MRNSIKLGMLALLASTALMTAHADAASAPNSNGIRAAIDAQFRLLRERPVARVAPLLQHRLDVLAVIDRVFGPSYSGK